MKIVLEDKYLTKLEKNDINKLLKRENINISDNLEQMWYMIDLVWDDYGCDNKNLNWENMISPFL